MRRELRGMSITRGCILASLLMVSGCATTAQNIGLGAAVATVVGGLSPSHEIEQTYYLGVFDPQEQLPPMVYRVRVHGQASFISMMRFGSGWVRADLIDSLSDGVTMDHDTGTISFNRAGNDELRRLAPGRRLILYGPEGFREAPKNHRLVLVMGSNADGYFQAMDTVLGTYAQVASTAQESELNGILMREQLRISRDKGQVASLRARLDRELPAPTATAAWGTASKEAGQ